MKQRTQPARLVRSLMNCVVAVWVLGGTPGAFATTRPLVAPPTVAPLRPSLATAGNPGLGVLQSALQLAAGGGCTQFVVSPLPTCFGRAGARFLTPGVRRPVTLQLLAFGRRGALRTVPAVRPTLHGSRVSYRHAQLTVWWRVVPTGMEQGFTVRRPPPGTGDLRLELATDQTAVRSGEGLTWGPLHYGALVARDARGRRFPVRLRLHGSRLVIQVADQGAVYPLIIDPLVWIEQTVTPSDPRKITTSTSTSNPEFGYAVALSGNLAAVGAADTTVNGNGDQGVVYVFTRLSSGFWSQTAELTASDGAANDYFGTAVALSGTTLLVGTPGKSHSTGAAYVFTESGGTWTQTAELVGSEAAGVPLPPESEFGVSVALSDNGITALVSAPTYAGETGAAYVFTESGGTWSQTAQLTSSLQTTNLGLAFFGASVALSGNGTTALVGAPASNATPPGAAYVFTESGGTWSQTAMLSPASGTQYGLQVALSEDGTTAAVAQPLATVNGLASAGTVYIYQESGGNWTQTATLTGNDQNVDNVAMGNTLSLSGDGNIVFAGDYQGPGYVFTKAANGTWSQTSELSNFPSSNNGGIGGDASALSGTGSTILDGDDVSAYFAVPADLALNLNAPVEVSPSQQYSIDFTVTNNAVTASPNVTLLVPVPGDAGFVSASTSLGTCTGDNLTQVTCLLNGIPANGGTARIAITLKATGLLGSFVPDTGSILSDPVLIAQAKTGIALPVSISALAAQTLAEGQSTGPLPFILGGSLPLAVTAASSNTVLVPAGNIVVDPGCGQDTGADTRNCTVRVTLAAGQSGTATVTLTVTDGFGQRATTSFPVTVKGSSSAAAPPVAKLTATPSSGTAAPVSVQFNASGSSDPNSGGAITQYAFNFGDGSAQVIQSTPTVSHTYTAAGTYHPSVAVTDKEGGTASTTVTVTVLSTSMPSPVKGPSSGGGSTGLIDLLGLGWLMAWAEKRKRR